MDQALGTLGIFWGALWPWVKLGLWVLVGMLVFGAVVGYLQRRGQG